MSDSTSYAVQFNEIAAIVRRPGVLSEIRPLYSNLGIVGFAPRALVVGQLDGTGTAVAGTPYRITRGGQAEGLFGRSSHLAAMVNAFRVGNLITELWAIGAAAAAGSTSATATLTVTAPPSQAGTLPLRINGKIVPAILPTGQTVTQVAALIVAQVAADPSLPVTAANVAGVVTFTAKQAGAFTNDIDIRIGLDDQEVAPLGFAAALTAMSGGAGAPDVTPLLARVSAVFFTDIAMGWNDMPNIATLNTELARRYGAMVELDARAYVGWRGTLSAFLAAFGNGAVNGKLLYVIPAFRAASPPWLYAASLCAVAAFALGNDPARQLRTLALPGIYPPAPSDRFLDSDHELLLANGGATFNALSDGTVVLERVISTYQISVDGVPDTAWLDIMTAAVMTRIRYDWRSFVKLQWSRAKLVDDDSPAAILAANVVTAKLLKGAWAGRCKLYEGAAWIEGAKATSALATFTRDPTDHNRVNSEKRVRVVGNLMVEASALEFVV